MLQNALLLGPSHSLPPSERALSYKTESAIVFEDMSVMNRAGSLAIYELLGDANMMNTELDRYRAVSIEDILGASRELFDPRNSNTLYYYSEKK